MHCCTLLLYRPGSRGTGTCHALASRPGISTTTDKQGGIMTETERPRTLTGHTHVREAEDFDSVYMQGVPPWDIGRSQPAFAELAERGLLVGRVLDAGCGTGEHALMAAPWAWKPRVSTSPPPRPPLPTPRLVTGGCRPGSSS
jgi:hypothetical protein